MYCTANCLELKNVSFSYGDKEVLHSVSMSLKKGGQYAIVGPSGSGKTSIIIIISVIVDPQRRRYGMPHWGGALHHQDSRRISAIP